MVCGKQDHIRRVYLVCEKQKWCYIAIQKVAGTSIRYAFLDHVGAPHQENSSLREELEPWRLSQIEVLRRQDLHRWGFMRDPRERLVSCWINKIASDKPDPFCTWRVNQFYGWKFDDFIKAVCEQKNEEMDQHFAPQTMFLTYKSLPLYDELFRLDQIQDSWKKLQNRYGLPDLKHANKTKRSNWRDYYTNKTEQIVLDRYSDDMTLFNSLS